MSYMLFNNEKIEYKRLFFHLNNSTNIFALCCDNYKIEDDFIRTYLDGNLTSIIPISNVDMESISYE